MAETGTKHIVVIDDDEGLCRLLSLRLKKEGFHVSTTSSGREGVSLIKKELPQLVILDIQMPDLDGASVSAELKSEPLTKNIPIIFLTGLEKKDEESGDSHYLGTNIVFAKPYDPEELLTRIRSLLR
jgi:DNA-binding response OmpR family regulator